MPSMTESVFIGIDLAWGETNPSGWAVLKGDQERAELVEVNTLPSCEGTRNGFYFCCYRRTTDHQERKGATTV